MRRKLQFYSTVEIPCAPYRLTYDYRNEGVVTLKLAHDFEQGNHCLIFALETRFTKPEQLQPLGLTKRETEIAFWILQRKTNWEIGRILHVSQRTVDKHMENILRKQGLETREALVTKARQTCG